MYPHVGTCFLGVTTHPANQSSGVHTFFSHLYWTAAESMPTKILSSRYEKKHLAKIFSCFLRGLCCERNPRFEPSKTSEDLREELMVKLMDRMLLGPTHQVFDMDPTVLPARELPPGNVSNLYLMYLAYVRPSGQPPACKSTFYTVWKGWASCLRFRHPSEHTMCVQCQTLKAAIRASTESYLHYDFAWL